MGVGRAAGASVAMLALFLVGCAHARKTPFDHLYGEQWCDGVYGGYADEMQSVKVSVKEALLPPYGVLSVEGVAALERLQGRETPFWIYADDAGDRFVVEREVPERLTYTAEMTEADRARARRAFEEAREHLASDYADVERLEWALNGLLDQLVLIGAARAKASSEMMNAAHIRREMQEGRLPFTLPYQVSAADYERVLLLILARLERDDRDLARMEAGIATVALSVRATGADGESSSSNVEAAILAALKDLEAAVGEAAEAPGGAGRREMVEDGEKIWARIIASEEYAQFVAAKKEEGPDPLGAMLGVVDMVAGTRLSGVAKGIRALISGRQPDYLELLQAAASFVPSGTAVGQLLDGAVEVTEKYRGVVAKVRKVEKNVKEGVTLGEAIREGDVDLSGVVNLEGAVERAGDQVVFIAKKEGKRAIREQLREMGVTGVGGGGF